MSSSRWERVQAIFHLAADLPEKDREPYVSAKCVDDPTLAAEVLELLEEDSRGGSLLDRDVSHVARAILDAPIKPVLPLESFGPYRISSVLGEGGMVTRRNRSTGETVQLPFLEADMRFMTGVYRGDDGRVRRGTFGFI